MAASSKKISMRLFDITVKNIRKIPKGITYLQIIDDLSLECMIEINKLDRIKVLYFTNPYGKIEIDVATEIAKSTTIESIEFRHVGHIEDEDVMNELLKSKTITALYVNGKPFNICRSIVLKHKLNHDGKIPKRVLKFIHDNESIRWKIPKK